MFKIAHQHKNIINVYFIKIVNLPQIYYTEDSFQTLIYNLQYTVENCDRN